MALISLEKFIKDNTGKRLAVPWGYKGECVSLAQVYLHDCLGYAYKARGNAKNWVNTLKSAGIAKKATGKPQRGDIIVYGSSYGGGYGHLGVADGKGNMFDQNNTMGGRKDKSAGLIKIFGTYTIMRPVKKPPVDATTTPSTPTPKPTTPTSTLKKGDKVQIMKSGKERADGTGKTATNLPYKREILKEHKGAKYPYQVGNSKGTTGFYKAKALKKL